MGGLSKAALVPLGESFARLYPTTEDWRRVVFDAGMDAGLVNFEGPAFTFWFVLLLRVDVAQREALIAVAVDTYPDDGDLVDAVGQARSRPPADTSAAPEVVATAERRTESVVAERPLLGREELLGRLSDDLARVSREGVGLVRVLRGESGVGKSRLAERAGRVAAQAGMVVVQAQCVGSAAEAFLPFRQALADLHARSPVEQLLTEASAGSVQFLRAFLRQEGPDVGGQSAGSPYEGLAGLLLGLAERRGLCLVVEDLTDADQDTLHFLDYLRRRAATGRVLSVWTVKTDLVDDGLRDLMDKWEADGCGISDVPPLPPDVAAELVTLVWDGPDLTSDEVHRIVTLSAGNPFFIEQILSLVREEPSVDASLDDVPPRVQAVLRRRLQRVDDRTRGFLEGAAVALDAAHGIELIVHVADLDEKTGSALLRRACELGCLTEDAGGRVLFSQELLRRVVYEGIGPGAGRRMHGRAAEWLEKANLLSSAAHHYGLAERTEDLVRTALDGARREESRGVYRSALQLYELARPYVEPRVIGPRIVKAHIILGQLSPAEELLDGLSPDDREVRLLRSDLLFMRGDFSGALEETELAVQASADHRVETLMHLGGIHLYLGELDKAADSAREALELATDSTDIARCKGLLGASAFYGGDVDQAEQRYTEALSILSSQSAEERDRTAYTVNLGNLASAAEVRGNWEGAKRLNEEALAIRREVSDARGELHSLHAVARSEIALGATDRAEALLAEARTLATALEDALELGKLDHTLAELALARGEPSVAVRLTERALHAFRRSHVSYDVAHARFTLATAATAAGTHRRAVEDGARARVDAERNGFGLLHRLYPTLGFSFAERIEAAILAYACSDAFGLPWEGAPPGDIDMAIVPSMPARSDWPKGSTSDDTALTLLVAEHLVATGGPDPHAFMALLAARAPAIKGLGPSTTGAIDHFRGTGTLPTEGGNTNGAVMRSFPIGWALPLDRIEDRRKWTITLTRATHPGPEACSAACVGSACAAWALEGANPQLLLEVATEEAAAAAGSSGAGTRLQQMLVELAAGRWAPPPSGVSLDPCDTVVAALWCVTKEPRLPEAIVKAVSIGGDTDTVAALVGGLLGSQHRPRDVRALLPWSSDVTLPEPALVTRLSAGLAHLRSRRADG